MFSSPNYPKTPISAPRADTSLKILLSLAERFPCAPAPGVLLKPLSVIYLTHKRQPNHRYPHTPHTHKTSVIDAHHTQYLEQSPGAFRSSYLRGDVRVFSHRLRRRSDKDSHQRRVGHLVPHRRHRHKSHPDRRSRDRGYEQFCTHRLSRHLRRCRHDGRSEFGRYSRFEHVG